MSQYQENDRWLAQFQERRELLQSVFGESFPHNTVTSFAWKEFVLPGACSMTFAPRDTRSYYSAVTLGLSQPLDDREAMTNFEFIIKSFSTGKWINQLLYDLLTYWMDQRPPNYRGLFLPVSMFLNSGGELCSGLTSRRHGLKTCGDIVGLFLWDESDCIAFKSSESPFQLVAVVLVTQNELALSQLRTPPHLLLLLCHFGVAQIAQPLRRCVTSIDGFSSVWNRIERLSHAQVLRELGTFFKAG